MSGTIGHWLFYAIQKLRRSQSLDLFSQIERTPYLDQAQIQEIQWQRLSKLLDHAEKNVPYYREMFRSLGASRWQTFTHLMVPGSLPVMFAGLKTAAGLSLVGAVVGEFISAERGLGVLVQQFSSQLAIADAFAVILMLMFLGLLLYGAMEWLERATVFWLHDARLVARSKRRAARAQKRLARGGGVPSGPTPTLAGRR